MRYWTDAVEKSGLLPFQKSLLNSKPIYTNETYKQMPIYNNYERLNIFL